MLGEKQKKKDFVKKKKLLKKLKLKNKNSLYESSAYIAQLVRALPYKGEVDGSNPSLGI